MTRRPSTPPGWGQFDSGIVKDTCSGCGDLSEKCREIGWELDASGIHRDLVEGVVSILGEKLNNISAVDAECDR